MSTLRSRHKQFHFNFIKSPLYLLVKLKISQNSQPITAGRSVEPIVPNLLADSRLMFYSFFSCLLENSFSSFLTENILRSHGLYQSFILKLNMVNFSM